MIITCGECKTQYAVSSSALGSKGRTVKCSNCKHSWYQDPLVVAGEDGEVPVDPPEKADEIPVGAALPVLGNFAPASFATKMTFASLLVIALFFGLIAYKDSLPGLKSFYSAIGMYSTEGLAFREFKVDKERVKNKLQFSVKGIIENESKKTKYVPDIVITVLSKGDNVLGTLTLEPPKRNLLPFERMEIAPEINNVSGNAEKIVLDIGNKWELLFR